MNISTQSETRILLVAALLFIGLSPASATTTVARINFQDNAFADTVLASFGSYTLGAASTLQAAVTGAGLDKYAYSSTPGACIELGFTDNFLVNGPGNDLALFEFGMPDSFRISLTLGGVSHNYLCARTGLFGAGPLSGNSVTVAQVNLDDFGLAPGTQLSSIVVGMDLVSRNGTMPSLSVVGALNSEPVPEPSPVLLLASGLAARFFRRRLESLPTSRLDLVTYVSLNSNPEPNSARQTPTKTPK